jgi:hypothetical protein
MHSYRVSGLSVASEMELPGAIAVAPAAVPDVTVRFGDVPQQFMAPSASGPSWERAGDTMLLRVPRLARFLICGGATVTVALEPGAAAADASGFVLGSSLGIALHQRGALVLHGAAVARDGRAIVICGRSGAGKSTLAAALSQRGCSFVSDDICVVALNADRAPIVQPDGRQMKLWQDSISGLGLEARRGDAVREPLEKYFVSPDLTVGEPPLLAAIYQLQDDRPPFKAGIEALTLPDALRMLETEAYRPAMRRQLSSAEQVMSQAGATLGRVRAFRLARPQRFGLMDATVEALMAHWQELDR